MAKVDENKVFLTRRPAVTQVHPLGCAVACVAFLTGTSYARALRLFANPAHAWSRGFFCPEIVGVLKASGLDYRWRKVSGRRQDDTIPAGSIIFVGPSERYPSGHFLVKCGNTRYMNPWKSCPVMTPVRSGFDREPPGTITYVVSPRALVGRTG